MSPPDAFPEEHLEDFKQHEWCNEILSDPSITKTMKRQMPPPYNTSVSNSFFTKTLFTDDAIRAFLSLYRPGKDVYSSEALLLISVGKGVDGGLRRLHGGVTASLLDQVMGVLVSYTYQNTSATAELTIKYKKKVDTPCVLLCRARIVKEAGRWIETFGTVEDGQGTVFAEGRGSFVKSRPEEGAKI